MKAVTNTPIRLGLIGAGSVVANYHLPVLQGVPRVRFEWVTDPNLSRARELAKVYRIPTATASLDECGPVDAVLVATPVGERKPIMQKIAEHGWHALVEKPFAATTADHEWMIDLTRRHDVVATVGLVRRFYEATKRARKILRAELLGPIEEILAGEGLRARKFGRGGDWYQGSADAAGGVFFETGSHLVDAVFTMCDVTGFQLEHCEQSHAGALEVETRALATVTLATGSSVPFRVAVSRLHDVYNGTVVRCRNGELRIPADVEASTELWSKSGEVVTTLPGTPKPGLQPALIAEWDDFLDRVANGDATPTDTGLLTTRFIEGAYSAARRTAPSRTNGALS